MCLYCSEDESGWSEVEEGVGSTTASVWLAHEDGPDPLLSNDDTPKSRMVKELCCI